MDEDLKPSGWMDWFSGSPDAEEEAAAASADPESNSSSNSSASNQTAPEEPKGEPSVDELQFMQLAELPDLELQDAKTM